MLCTSVEYFLEAMVLKHLTQEAFDDAVRQNIDDLDLEEDEAVQSAVEEFEMQGYDLTGIIKEVNGGQRLAQHPIKQATEEVSTSLANSQLNIQQLRDGLSSLSEQLQLNNKELMAQALTAATKFGTVAALVRACEVLASRGEDGEGLLVSVLQLMRRLMVSQELRGELATTGGLEVLHQLAKTGSQEVKAATLAVADAASYKEENNKCRLVFIGFATTTLDLLKEPQATEPVIMAACGCLRAFTTADDERPPASKAFSHARMLAKQEGGIQVLFEVLQRLGPDSPEACAAVLAAVKSLACNEEVCKSFNDVGGVTGCLDIVRAARDHSGVVRYGMSSLRQLANSDPIKGAIARHGGLDLTLSLLRQYPGVLEVQEQVLGLVVSMTLRQPDICEMAAEAGWVEGLVGVMSESPESPAVQRQACMAIRNMVVRNPELRPQFVSQGVEALLREAKKRHPAQCQDVGSAALRDLGFDNYNS